MVNPKKPLVPAHGSSRKSCKLCNIPHTINQHRMHGKDEEGHVRKDVFCKYHKSNGYCQGKAINSIFAPIEDVVQQAMKGLFG